MSAPDIPWDDLDRPLALDGVDDRRAVARVAREIGAEVVVPDRWRAAILRSELREMVTLTCVGLAEGGAAFHHARDLTDEVRRALEAGDVQAAEHALRLLEAEVIAQRRACGAAA